jgi:hypothetical protein
MWDGPEPITHHKSYRGKRRRFGKLTDLSRSRRATKAKRRQDEQDLQDGFSLRPTVTIHSFQLNPITSFILSIQFILSKNQVSI